MSNMSHLPSFLTTDPNDDLAAPVAEPNPGAFAWPTPPYAIYPTSLPQQEPEPCEIEGQNGKVMQASLLAYLPAQNVIQLVVPPARKAMALRPNRFRRITLLTRRAASVKKSVHAGEGLIQLDLKDLRGSDELGLLAGVLTDLMHRVNEDVRREQLRAEQEKDRWHAVGHEIMAPLQSLSALHADDTDASLRYVRQIGRAHV